MFTATTLHLYYALALSIKRFAFSCIPLCLFALYLYSSCLLASLPCI